MMMTGVILNLEVLHMLFDENTAFYAAFDYHLHDWVLYKHYSYVSDKYWDPIPVFPNQPVMKCRTNRLFEKDKRQQTDGSLLQHSMSLLDGLKLSDDALLEFQRLVNGYCFVQLHLRPHVITGQHLLERLQVKQVPFCSSRFLSVAIEELWDVKLTHCGPQFLLNLHSSLVEIHTYDGSHGSEVEPILPDSVPQKEAIKWVLTTLAYLGRPCSLNEMNEQLKKEYFDLYMHAVRLMDEILPLEAANAVNSMLQEDELVTINRINWILDNVYLK